MRRCARGVPSATRQARLRLKLQAPRRCLEADLTAAYRAIGGGSSGRRALSLCASIVAARINIPR
jgi:hypothetical protein